MISYNEFRQNITRRYFFQQGSHAIGAAALASLMGNSPGGGMVHGAELAGASSSASRIFPAGPST
jgi:hypothetical protein